MNPLLAPFSPLLAAFLHRYGSLTSYHFDLVLEYCCWYSTNKSIHLSGFNTLSIGSGPVAAVFITNKNGKVLEVCDTDENEVSK